mgnify:CR=1 FL=1
MVRLCLQSLQGFHQQQWDDNSQNFSWDNSDRELSWIYLISCKYLCPLNIFSVFNVSVFTAHNLLTVLCLTWQRWRVVKCGHAIMLSRPAQWICTGDWQCCHRFVSSSLGLGSMFPVSYLHINPYDLSLLIGTHYLGAFQHRETKDHTGKQFLTSHTGPCTQCLYNPVFDLVILA